jgi:hypothetical protein
MQTIIAVVLENDLTVDVEDREVRSGWEERRMERVNILYLERSK